jgi:hypothetical protein
MSAYMCSERELSVLAAYAVKHCLKSLPSDMWATDIDGHGLEWHTGGHDRVLARAFAMLMAENLASLFARYPRDAREHDAISDAYSFQKQVLRAHALPPLHIIKLCHHYAYQACEHDGWEASAARKLMAAIEAHAVRELPGYADAPWGLD